MNIFKQQYLTWYLFFAGFIMFYFTRTVTFVPIAIVIAPVFLLMFLRSQKMGRSIFWLLLGFTLTLTLSLWGLFSFEDKVFSLVFNTLRSLLIAIVLAIPYTIDRLFAGRVKGFMATFIFPLAATVWYYFDATYGPLDGTGIFFAYTQYGNLTLMQGLSLFGLWGMVFLLSWVSSFIVWIWENRLQWEKIRKGSVLFACIMLLVYIFGGVKVSPFFEYKEKTVRIAAITFLPGKGADGSSIENIVSHRLYTPFPGRIQLMEFQIKDAVSAGAKIMAFQEYSIVLRLSDESLFLEQIRSLAQKYSVYICTCYAVFPELKSEKGENKAVFVSPSGEIKASYVKHHLATGESLFMKRGPGIIPVVSTPYGKIGITICRDFEYPAYFRQLAGQDVDMVLAPSYDFPKAVTPSNTYNQMLRAVENGFSFVRPVHSGLSVAVDYNGRILSSMNYFTTRHGTMYADVPVRGICTLYSLIGDSLVWIAMVMCLLLGGSLFYRHARSG